MGKRLAQDEYKPKDLKVAETWIFWWAGVNLYNLTGHSVNLSSVHIIRSAEAKGLNRHVTFLDGFQWDKVVAVKSVINHKKQPIASESRLSLTDNY